MSSATDERVLQSFLADDESLVSTATVAAVQRGFTTTPPQAGEAVTVGVTESRLLWFDDELAEIELAEIDGVERGSVAHQSAPTIVRIGSFVMMAGVVAGLVGGLLAGQPLPVSLGLALSGVAVFAATIAIARVRGAAGGGFEKHRLQVTADDDLVLLWGHEDALGTLASALADQRSS